MACVCKGKVRIIPLVVRLDAWIRGWALRGGNGNYLLAGNEDHAGAAMPDSALRIPG